MPSRSMTMKSGCRPDTPQSAKAMHCLGESTRRPTSHEEKRWNGVATAVHHKPSKPRQLRSRRQTCEHHEEKPKLTHRREVCPLLPRKPQRKAPSIHCHSKEEGSGKRSVSRSGSKDAAAQTQAHPCRTMPTGDNRPKWVTLDAEVQPRPRP